MIIGIGIDLVEIARFNQWHTKPFKQLERIFHPDEIVYCLSEPAKSAERFAARFAAREALYKATGALPGYQVPFLTLCKMVQVTRRALVIEGLKDSNITAHLSLSHSKSTACAVVIIER